jgi:hypothetical protein
MFRPGFQLSALLAAVLPIAAAAQQRATTSGVTATTTTSTNTCSGDKIQLTGFSISPAAPALNQTVTVKVDVKNLCGQTLSIPYKIADGSSVLNSGSKSVSANQTATVQYTFTATAGNHSLDAYLDSGNTLNESSSYQANNGATNVIAFSIAAPTLATEYLKKEPAQSAGAQFNIVLESGTGCVVKTMTSGTSANIPVLYITFSGGPPCGRAVFEAYSNFTLKNGWKVKSVLVEKHSDAINSDWEWVTKPATGSSNPAMKWRCKTANDLLPLECRYNIRISIEGPSGTSPY